MNTTDRFVAAEARVGPHDKAHLLGGRDLELAAQVAENLLKGAGEFVEHG